MGLTIEGLPINATQRNQARILMGVAQQLGAGSIATEALICAAIGESTLTNLSQPNGSGYWGVLQGGSGFSGSSPNFPPPNGWNDSVGMATAFLQGGRGFGNGAPGALRGKGVIDFVRAGQSDPGTLATWAEDSGAAASFYGQHLPDAKAIIAALGGAALKGGVAGAGGSGTVTDGSASTTYAFEIGGAGNPDEDFWTGVNRLAQEVNWYLFSSGEYLYFMDGQEMLAQQPAAHIDRVADAARIHQNQGSLSYDNTAFSYVSDHKRRFTARRRTKVALAQSPTEGTFELICGIDEILGGDVIMLSGFGLADGRWIVAESRRSVFDVYSELTLVPALAPISELVAAGTTGTNAGSEPKQSGAPITPGGATTGPVGIVQWSGSGSYSQDAVPMCIWIANELNWGLANGWEPGYPVTSGYRPGPDPHTSTGASEHQGTAYPGGAIDFGGAVNPAGYYTKQALIKLAAQKNYPGPRLQMPVFKYNPQAIGGADDGHCSGNGH